MKPSYTKGQRMKPFVAPTIFIMAISSRRSKVVSLMVLEMMNTETTNNIAMSAMHTTPATFRSVMKPSARFSSARASAIPVTFLTASRVSSIRPRSITLMAKRSRRISGSRSPRAYFPSYFFSKVSQASSRVIKRTLLTFGTASTADWSERPCASVSVSSTKARISFSLSS